VSDSLDFLESLGAGPRFGGRYVPRKIAKPNYAGAVTLAVLAFVGIVFGGAYIAYELLAVKPATNEWVNAPKTYAEAVQLWKTEIEILAAVKMAREARVNQLEKKIEQDEWLINHAPSEYISFETGRRCRDEELPQDKANLLAESKELDHKIIAQESRVERARKRKNELDH
jgi:hypothetical protein